MLLLLMTASSMVSPLGMVALLKAPSLPPVSPHTSLTLDTGREKILFSLTAQPFEIFLTDRKRFVELKKVGKIHSYSYFILNIIVPKFP